jgi:DNA-binding HxlR family transcriptional regulator
MDTNWPVPESEQNACALTRMLLTLGGKWKCIILWWVMDGPRRFTELRRRMPGITQKMLTQQLRDLERDGFLERRVYAEVPPRVEYTATPLTRTLRPVLLAMHEWAAEHLPQHVPNPPGKPRAGQRGSGAAR